MEWRENSDVGYPQLMDGIVTSQRCSTHAGAHISQRQATFPPHIRTVALCKVSALRKRVGARAQVYCALGARS